MRAPSTAPMLTSPRGDALNSTGIVLLGLGAAASMLCCSGSTVRLGDKVPQPYHFDPPRLLSELDTAFINDNPTLTGDLLDIYFTSNRDHVSTDVWHAHRGHPDD